jgi:hypothetical protein
VNSSDHHRLDRPADHLADQKGPIRICQRSGEGSAQFPDHGVHRSHHLRIVDICGDRLLSAPSSRPVQYLIFSIMGAVAVSKGRAYRFPFAIRLLK